MPREHIAEDLCMDKNCPIHAEPPLKSKPRRHKWRPVTSTGRSWCETCGTMRVRRQHVTTQNYWTEKFVTVYWVPNLKGESRLRPPCTPARIGVPEEG